MSRVCQVCGYKSEIDGDVANGKCPQCAVPVEIASKLPPFSDLSSAEQQDVNPWAAANLRTHPGTPWELHLPEGQPQTITAKVINYIDVLDKNTSLFLWCPPDQQQLYVRDLMQQDSEDRWLTIRGEVCRYGRLQPGDLLTIGSYPWVFHAYARNQGFGLEPANPLAGASIQMEDVRVGKRLSIRDLGIDSGSFVGIIGSSGSGKSTLVREIAETRVGRGRVLIGGHSRDKTPDPAVETVAYVPQKDVVYDDLTVIQQTTDFVKLVKPRVKRSVIEESLRVVGLRNLVDRFPSQLSGGQLRRMRLAAALARRPGVLLLDEPDSGLDPETAISVRRLLRTIGLLGATVITVTHYRHSMELFDRVLTLDQGRIVDDSLSLGLQAEISGEPMTRATRISRLKQFTQIFLRECVKFKQRAFLTAEFWPLGSVSLPQWLLVGLLIPSLFGIAIALAVPINDFHPHLVGFLCVLSVIWMSASQSHLALTTDWYRTEYERWQGLQTYSFIAAKSLFLIVITTIQTCLFFAVLLATRYYYLNQPIFYGQSRDQKGVDAVLLGEQYFAKLDEHRVAVFVTLLVVGIAASQVGLLISALAKWRTLVAASILPLVMIVQILFSPFVIRASKSDAILNETYAGFWWQDRCQAAENCPSKSLVYRPGFGIVCERCVPWSATYEEHPQGTPEGSHKTKLGDEEIEKRLNDKDSIELPIRPTVIASYGTLTRYADLTLRGIITQSEGEEAEKKYGYASLRQFGLTSLLAAAFGCHLLTTLLIGCVSPKAIFQRLKRTLMKAGV